MRTHLPILATVAILVGCSSNDQVRRVETPVNVTHEVAFGDYRRVFNTAYHILNRYGVIQRSSYRYGEITALVSEDTSLFDKTRRTIQARIFDNDGYWEVECRVLLSVEQSEPATFQDQFHPRYEWYTVSGDPQLEVRLNNEIRGALSGGAWEAKEPLTPKPRAPHAPRARPAPRKASGDSGATKEVSHDAETEVASRDAGAEAFERLGILRLQRGAYGSAAKAFRAAIKSGQGKHSALFAHYLLAQALFSQGIPTGALDALRAGAEANPAWARSDMDVRDLYGGDPEVFEVRMEELESSCREDAELYLLLGYMKRFSADPAGAIRAFDRYLEEHPGDGLALSYREACRSEVDAAHGLEDF